MRIALSTFAVTFALAATPTLALAGPMSSPGTPDTPAPAPQALSQASPTRSSPGPTLLSGEAMSKVVAGYGNSWNAPYNATGYIGSGSATAGAKSQTGQDALVSLWG